MKKAQERRGSALIITLLFLALMLVLVLYYVSLVRMETTASGFTTVRSLTRQAMDRALAEAVAALEQKHVVQAQTMRTTLSPADLSLLVSSGEGGALTGGLTVAEVNALAWPEPDQILAHIDTAEWILTGQTNDIHQAYAWAVIPLTGLLDPEGIAGWSTDDLGFVRLETAEETFFSPRELMERYPLAQSMFLPGNYTRDRGWYDFDTMSWQTNLTIGSEIISMNPLEWSEAESAAVFEALYPDRDFAALSEAFMDFRDGKEMPGNPDGITAVPVPMFNEVHALMTVSNLGSSVMITHHFEMEIWYPFEGNLNTNFYRVAKTPALEARIPGSAFAELNAMDSDADWTIPAPSGPVESAFATMTMIQSSEFLTFTAGQSLELDWLMEGVELEELNADVVDRFPAGFRMSLPPVTIPASGGVEEVKITLEVQDPILNHQADRWIPATTNSLFSINQAALDVRLNDGLADEWIKWTPAGKAGEWEEGWIGYFPLDEPWRSVDLFSTDGQWWLKHTRKPDWEAGKWTRSRVNPNTTFTNALASIFIDLPKRRWPGETTTNQVSFGEAQGFATELTSSYQLFRGADQRGEWTDEMGFVLPLGNGGRHQAESVVSESLERLDVGYQMYGILLWSETRIPGGRARSRQQHSVILWLDPFPNKDGRHEVMYVFRHPVF